MPDSGRVFAVGLGPGGADGMTAQARRALDAADVLCGYTAYLELAAPLYPDKPTHATGMTKELERCRWALETASAGQIVALVCSGDAGVYGMASPLLELAPGYPTVDVEIIPGVTAALAGAAVLGAPLGHDFCVLSLSDLLTPWYVIEKRLQCAAAGDFAVALYNPASHRRPDHLRRAVQVLLDAGADPDTACGTVENIGRPGETARLYTLAELADAEVNMFTTVFIGSSATQRAGRRLVTPRGYPV